MQAATQRKLEIKNGNRPEEIEQSKQEYLESLSNLEQLRSDLVRNRRLTGSASLSQREMDVASFSFEGVERKCSKLKSAYDLMVKGPREEKLKAAEAEVDQAVADLAKAQWRLNNCVIVAPVSGVILTKNPRKEILSTLLLLIFPHPFAKWQILQILKLIFPSKNGM